MELVMEIFCGEVGAEGGEEEEGGRSVGRRGQSGQRGVVCLWVETGGLRVGSRQKMREGNKYCIFLLIFFNIGFCLFGWGKEEERRRERSTPPFFITRLAPLKQPAHQKNKPAQTSDLSSQPTKLSPSPVSKLLTLLHTCTLPDRPALVQSFSRLTTAGCRSPFQSDKRRTARSRLPVARLLPRPVTSSCSLPSTMLLS